MKTIIQETLEVLKKGGVILYPTDTIWGIGCDATNPDAVNRVFEIKKREKSKSMLILLDSINKVGRYIKEIPEMAIDIMELSTNPVTLILPGAINLAEGLMAEDGSIGIRITNDEFSNELIRKFNKPIVSSSANFAGQPSPENFLQIDPKLIEMVDYVVDYKQNDMNFSKPSSIIKLGLNSDIKIIRT
jgi:L-threonylcarbamoyladenylate synthase